MKGDSGPSSLEQRKGVRVVVLIPAIVPAARKPETVISQVNSIQSSPLLFFFLSHFIRDASSHSEQLPSFYFCLFFFSPSVRHCQVDLGRHQNKAFQNSR